MNGRRCPWVALIGLALVATLVVLPSATAKPRTTAKPQATASYRLATGMCGQERAALGKRAFRLKYGFGHPMRACVKVTRQLINAAGRLAVRDCGAELAALGAEDFIDEYGEDENSMVGQAMAACIAETIDAILYPDRVLEGE